MRGSNDDFRGIICNPNLIKRYSVKPGTFTANTLLLEYVDCKIYVRDMIHEIGKFLSEINHFFIEKEENHVETIKLLHTLLKVFNNQQQKVPSKKQMHYLVEVKKEVENIKTDSPMDKIKNEAYAKSLDYLIDYFMIE